MRELIAHIEAQNAKAKAWMDEQPGRWAGMLVTDPEHWAEMGILTVEDFQREMAIEAYHDIYKDRYGVRPRHVNFDEMTLEEIEEDLKLISMLEADDD